MNAYKAARLKAGMTQEELAAAVHVTQGSISQWERGMTNPDFKTLILLADVLCVSVDELIGRNSHGVEDNIEALNDEEKELLTIFRSVNRTGKDTILQVARVTSGSHLAQEGLTQNKRTS